MSAVFRWVTQNTFVVGYQTKSDKELTMVIIGDDDPVKLASLHNTYPDKPLSIQAAAIPDWCDYLDFPSILLLSLTTFNIYLGG